MNAQRALLLTLAGAAIALSASLPHAAFAAPVSDAPQVVPVTACVDLQSRIDEVMVPLASRVGEGAVMDVTLRTEHGRVVDVRTDGGAPAYQRGLRRALRDARCGLDGERRLRVLVADPWNRVPS